jgi:predicted ribosomally synthesized peptide with nif11-like leader
MENAALFMNILAQDQKMQEALVAATESAATKEEKVAATARFAQEAGFKVSTEELQKFVEVAQNSTGSLSDDDLDNVAGGIGGVSTADVTTLVGKGVGEMIGANYGAGSTGQEIGGIIGNAAAPIVNKAGDEIASATTTSANAVAHTATSVYYSVASVFHGW